MKDSQHPSKADLVRQLLEREGRVMLCLDATRKGVEVPRRFRTDPGLRLILNVRMPQPIDINERAIESELRFGGIPHYCVVPYEALWGAFNPDNGHGSLWPEAMPEAVRKSYETTLASETSTQAGDGASIPPAPEAAPAPAADPVGPGSEGEKPRLEVVPGRTPAAESSVPQRSRGHLKLVK
ncbi:MAG: ClpXP protease specificity-enhancing factor SspB [Magnetococcus sp. WYHC-3]